MTRRFQDVQVRRDRCRTKRTVQQDGVRQEEVTGARREEGRREALGEVAEQR
jgi:hypothetical protein